MGVGKQVPSKNTYPRKMKTVLLAIFVAMCAHYAMGAGFTVNYYSDTACKTAAKPTDTMCKAYAGTCKAARELPGPAQRKTARTPTSTQAPSRRPLAKPLR